jgi:hypothetical protein
MFPLAALIYSVGFAVITAAVARTQNRSPRRWFVLGLFLGVLALLALLLMERSQDQGGSDGRGIQALTDRGQISGGRCPVCDGDLATDGGLCVHCGLRLDKRPHPIPSTGEAGHAGDPRTRDSIQ